MCRCVERIEFGSKMDPTLYQAAMTGNVDVLIRYKDHFETELTPKDNTVLHIAAMHGKTQGVERILQTCPPLLDRGNSYGDTLLHIAARAGHAGIVRALFDFVDRQNNDIEIGRFIREMLGGKNVDGDTAFHMAVRNGHLDVVKLLLEKDSTFSYMPNIKNETPLYLAGKNGFDGIVSEILKTDTSLLYGGPDSRTALHAAIIFGSRGCTAKLLNWRGSLAKEADVDGWTPLHHAACLGHAQLVENLLFWDKSVAYLTSYENDGKKTALHIAASQGHVNVIEVLLSRCPDCWEVDNIKGQNILHVAVENNKYNVIEYIKKNSSLNCLINQKDNAGNTCDPQLLAAPTNVPNTETMNPPPELRRADASSDLGSRNSVSNLSDNQNDSIEALRKMADTHMIVAALTATVTFTAGLTVPGGYYGGNDGPNPGMAILSRNAAFQGFIVTNTIALMCSVVAIILYFNAARNNDKAQLKEVYELAGAYVASALMVMMIAFVTGTYAVLAHSLSLAVPNCVLGSMIVCFNCLNIRHWGGLVARNNIARLQKILRDIATHIVSQIISQLIDNLKRA